MSAPAKVKLVHKAYPSFTELVRAAVNDTSELPDKLRASRHTDNDKWAGTSWDTACKLATGGDLAGAAKLRPAMLAAVNRIVHGMPRLDPVYRLDEGRWIDVARFVKGEPECWGDMVEAEPTRRAGAAVVFNVSAGAHNSAAAINRVGEEVGAAVLGLQAMGTSVTLYAAECTVVSYEERLITSAPLNAGGAVLDVAMLSVILRPWFLRRIMFSLEETYDADTRRRFDIGPGCGYGSPGQIRPEEARLIAAGIDRPIIIDVNAAVMKPAGYVRDLIINQRGK